MNYNNYQPQTNVLTARNNRLPDSWFRRLSPEERAGVIGAGVGAAITGLRGRLLPGVAIGAGALYAGQRYLSKQSAAAPAVPLQGIKQFLQSSPLLASAGAGAAVGALTAPKHDRAAGATSGALYGTVLGLLSQHLPEQYSSGLSLTDKQLLGGAVGGAYAGRTSHNSQSRRKRHQFGGSLTGFEASLSQSSRGSQVTDTGTS